MGCESVWATTAVSRADGALLGELADVHNTMGKVLTTITVTNRIDEAKAKEGLIAPEKFRSITLDNVLVDTGATTLCLPKGTITQLGLD